MQSALSVFMCAGLGRLTVNAAKMHVNAGRRSQTTSASRVVSKAYH